jgi:hypothetical protein
MAGSSLQASETTFWQRMILPEEDRRNQPDPPLWNGSYRWFRSANVIDLWSYRSAGEKQRIIEYMRDRQRAVGFWWS